MKRIMFAAILFASARSAVADPIALRREANVYALVGEGTVVTKDCTVTAEGALTARLSSERGRTWLTFLDRSGQEEAQCEVLAKVSRPRKVDRILLAVRK